jgi:hypothetical protein
MLKRYAYDFALPAVVILKNDHQATNQQYR